MTSPPTHVLVVADSEVAGARIEAMLRTQPALCVQHGTPGPLGRRTLTPRELEVLEMLAEGRSNRAIARRLRISTYTVKFHVASILDKLGARGRTEAVTLGVRRGLIAL